MAAESITVWLIEDNATFRRTVMRALDQEDGFHCLGGFGSCEDAFAALSRQPAPQVVLLDVGLPGMSGLDGIARFREQAPQARIIVLTVFEDEDKIFRAICAGAAGYLLKTAPVEEIARAIRDALAGGAPMNGRIARRVLDMFARFAPTRGDGDYGLTTRETQILEAMVKGRTKKEIAAQLDLSFHTVDTHLRNIYQKLEVNTRTGAVAKALKEKLV
ncbi:two component transcriptional regulator, LuxR family [Chthoniobacter flavus Ellin428]|uniref:Two component transcriptional regulator, LuxR family n=1 Tax=Chthoniobacter flavus Ellin428 TaxID=497964 RepID=B4D3N2_9BACT|nr:response regulator transcription factor [Chthoniobacter flavus]EDY18862.1 two component transcriptional regulator, LuxR family [Chthoniobacter flavus Ellin428]TCO93456.1 LuxR family two component transcriptional regulator [Chthoniobacter flavus]